MRIQNGGGVGGGAPNQVGANQFQQNQNPTFPYNSLYDPNTMLMPNNGAAQ